MLPVVIHATDVANIEFGIEHVRFRRVFGTVSMGDALVFIAQIREVELALLSAFYHIVEIILRIAIGIVRIDGDELNALVAVIALESNQTFFVGLRVGTMIAGEHDHHNAFTFERF